MGLVMKTNLRELFQILDFWTAEFNKHLAQLDNPLFTENVDIAFSVLHNNEKLRHLSLKQLVLLTVIKGDKELLPKIKGRQEDSLAMDRRICDLDRLFEDMKLLDTLTPVESELLDYLTVVTTTYNYFPDDLCDCLSSERIMSLLQTASGNSDNQIGQFAAYLTPLPPMPFFSQTLSKVSSYAIRQPEGQGLKFYKPELGHHNHLHLFVRFICSMILWPEISTPYDQLMAMQFDIDPNIDYSPPYELCINNDIPSSMLPTPATEIIDNAVQFSSLLSLSRNLRNRLLSKTVITDPLINKFLALRFHTFKNDLRTSKGLPIRNFNMLIGLYLYLKIKEQHLAADDQKKVKKVLPLLQKKI